MQASSNATTMPPAGGITLEEQTTVVGNTETVTNVSLTTLPVTTTTFNTGGGQNETMEEDIDTDNSTISNVANNVTVSDEELKEDEVMVSVLDVSDEANDTLEINADLNATAEVNSDNVDASEGNDNPEGFSTLEAANLEANHTAAETVDTSVLEDDIAEAELNRTDIAEGSIDETGDFEEPLLVNSSNIEEQSPLVLDSDSDKTLSAAVQKVSIREVEQ